MPRPFPFPINIGTDICSIKRIYSILKGTNGLRFVRRLLNEKERHEAQERVDAPLEKWRLAGRTAGVIEWKRKEMGLSVRELEKRRMQLKGMKESLDMEGGGGKTKSQIREDLRKAFEREIKLEQEAERRLAVEDKRIEPSKEVVASVGEMEEVAAESVGKEIASILAEGDEDMKTIAEAVQEVVDKKETEIKKWDKTPEQLKQKRLNDADLMIRVTDDHLQELKTAEGQLYKAAEFLAGRFAAKEAAIKAHHTRKLTFHSIAIHQPPSTDPLAGSRAPIAVILSEKGEWEDGQEAKISISHDRRYATAVCMAFEPRKNSQKKGVQRQARRGSNASKHVQTQETVDDIVPEEEKEEIVWTEKELELQEQHLAECNNPRRILKVVNLSPDITAEDLLGLFKGRSKKLRARIVARRDGTLINKRYGFVSFANETDARKAQVLHESARVKGKIIYSRWMGGNKDDTTAVAGRRVFRSSYWGTGHWVEYKEPEVEGKIEASSNADSMGENS